MTTLASFEGREVLGVGIEIRNAAGGLNEALNVDPAEWHKDDEITVVLRCKVEKIRHDGIKDTEAWKRVHIVTATAATVIDSDIVDEQLAEQAKRIEEAKGIQQFPENAGELEAEHFRGEHANDRVDGCPSCEAEIEAEREEAEADAAGGA